MGWIVRCTLSHCLPNLTTLFKSPFPSLAVTTLNVWKTAEFFSGKWFNKKNKEIFKIFIKIQDLVILNCGSILY